MSGPLQNGVTADTWRNLIVDAAVVYIDYGEPTERILGATNGGVTFGWAEFETRNPEIDGLKGHIKGATRITRATPQIEVNLIEWDVDALAQAFPGVVVTGADGVATIKRTARVIPESAYPKNVAMVGRTSEDKAVVVLVKNPLVLDGTQLPTEQNSETTATVTFVGHYDPANPEEEPWEIRYPLTTTVSAANSGVTATTPHDADGADASVVTITLEDADGDPIANVPSSAFTVTVTGDAVAGAVSQTVVPGTYTSTVANETDETVTVTVTVYGVQITQTASVTFS